MEKIETEGKCKSLYGASSFQGDETEVLSPSLSSSDIPPADRRRVWKRKKGPRIQIQMEGDRKQSRNQMTSTKTYLPDSNASSSDRRETTQSGGINHRAAKTCSRCTCERLNGALPASTHFSSRAIKSSSVGGKTEFCFAKRVMNRWFLELNGEKATGGVCVCMCVRSLPSSTVLTSASAG